MTTRRAWSIGLQLTPALESAGADADFAATPPLLTAFDKSLGPTGSALRDGTRVRRLTCTAASAVGSRTPQQTHSRLFLLSVDLRNFPLYLLHA